MTELAFAKSFLTTLDSRPSNLSPTHFEDPKNYPPRSAFILPKSPGPPFTKRQKTAPPPGSAPTLTLSLKSSRNPPLVVTLKDQASTLSILDIKESVSTQASIPVKALRILYNKKPVVDSKTLKDVLGEEVIGKGGKVEFGLMVIGGAATVMAKRDEEKEPIDDVGIGKGEEILKTDEFWGDLRGFLVQRLKDEKEGERLARAFKKAWEKS
ncbi:cell-cycle control medial ring component-domain-containing protein [Tricladium varicosporioides]|nr:cell-cycle control medial ring component-domain-containing protein [Hymenoscyphus varicosporioides]